MDSDSAPTWERMGEYIYWIGLVAVASAAASGALEAGRKPSIDLFGGIVVGLAAAVGGGSLRDLLLDRPVFWLADQTYLLVAIGSAAGAGILAETFAPPQRLFLLADAVGLALFTVSGTRIALDVGTPWFAASLMGVMTGAFGGILRDVLCNEIPIVFRSEVYATAAWAGALLLVVMRSSDLDRTWQAVVAGLLVFLLRMGGIRYGWRLPLLRTGSDGSRD